MSDTELTFMAQDRIEDSFFNRDSRFALIPYAADDPLILQAIVEGFIKEHATTKSHDTKNEIVGELMELHTQGSVLFPICAFWGRSALGDLSERSLAAVVEEFDPALFEVRDEILESFAEEEWTEREKKSRSFMFWKLLVAIHFAGHGVKTLDDITEAHLYQLAMTFRHNGTWQDWVPSWTRKNIRFMAEYLADKRNDPLFAVEVRRDLRNNTVASRVDDIVHLEPHLQPVHEFYERWIDHQNVLTKTSYRDGERLLINYLGSRGDGHGKNVYELLSPANLMPILGYAKEWQRPTTRINAISKIHTFTKWLAAEYYNASRQTVEIGLPDREVERFIKTSQHYVKQDPHREVAARGMPARFHHLLKEIIAGDDFAWPKSLVHKKSGKPLHWMTWSDRESGTTKSVFCEVLPRLMLLHLDLPLRNIQVRRLDSGEGDARMWDPATNRWTANTGPNAGYWERSGVKNSRRGVFREITTFTGQMTGFWVNSNKTNDAADLFGDKSGYEIPWQHDEALQNLAAMRAWQEKYNRVKGPLEHRDLITDVFHDDPGKAVRSQLPAKFYLFRNPMNAGCRGNEAPVKYKACHQFFHDALVLLRHKPLRACVCSMWSAAGWAAR